MPKSLWLWAGVGLVVYLVLSRRRASPLAPKVVGSSRVDEPVWNERYAAIS